MDTDIVDKLSVRQASQILQMDQSQTYRLFKENRIRNYKDESNDRNYTTRSDLLTFLNRKIPNDFKVVEKDADQISLS